MVFNILIGVGGLALMVVAFYALGQTFGAGIFRARGNRLIVREKHPIMFWANAVGMSIVAAIGYILVVIACNQW